MDRIARFLSAACNVLYLFTVDTESLTGPQAIRKCMGILMAQKTTPTATVVHFKASSQGITLTDNERKVFFRYVSKPSSHFPSTRFIRNPYIMYQRAKRTVEEGA